MPINMVVIVRKAARVKYGKRVITVKGKTIIADFKNDDTVDLFLMQDGVTTPIVTAVARQKARLCAKNIADFMSSFESVATFGRALISLQKA